MRCIELQTLKRMIGVMLGLGLSLIKPLKLNNVILQRLTLYKEVEDCASLILGTSCPDTDSTLTGVDSSSQIYSFYKDASDGDPCHGLFCNANEPILTSFLASHLSNLSFHTFGCHVSTPSLCAHHHSSLLLLLLPLPVPIS